MVLLRQVLPLDNECAIVSQKLIEAALRGDTETVSDCLGNSLVDVNYIGTVTLRVKCTETILHEEAHDEVKIEYEEFRTDVTALFVAAHAGHIDITRKLVVR